MLIKEIIIKNFKSFGNSEQKLEINQDNGELILLTGSNGNGKSSLIRSFEYVLYGKCKGNKKKWATLSDLPNRINGNDLHVNIKFKSGEDDIEVNRGIGPNILELYENGNDNDKAGKSNLNNKIEKYIGMDIDTFKSFISLSINDFKNFISLSNEEKKILLDKLFNLEVINILNNILKNLNKENKIELTKLDSEISTLSSSIESIKQSIKKSIEKEKENIQQEIDEIKELMESKKDEYVDLKVKLDKAKEKEQKLKKEIDKEKEQYIILNTEIKSIQKDINLYDSGKCPTCKTDFNNDHYDSLKSSLLEKKLSTEKIRDEVKDNISKIKERQLKLSEIKDTLNTSFNDLTYLLRNYKQKIKNLKSKKDNQEESTFDVSEFEKSISELDTKKEKASEEHSIKKEKSLYYKELSKIFGENGVKKSIISGIIKPINFFINENISKMNLPFQVSLDETFNANIKHFGMDIEQDSLSTGESKLINLSILIAYLKLIRTKKNINILFLDEVFSSIDIENIEKILNLLKSFSNEYKINIFVVHHAIMNEDLFDRIIKIKKNVFTEIEEVDLNEEN